MSDSALDLRKLAIQAHERELKNALLGLFGKFDQWRRGQMDPFELNDLVRQHVEMTAKELQAKYLNTPPETAVAMAVVSGVLHQDDVPEEHRPRIEPLVRYLRERGRT